jgi:hypothetical protein
MSILDDINNFEKLSTVQDLTDSYNLTKLYDMYKKLVDLENCQDHYFKKYIHNNNLEINRLEKFWEMKSNMVKLHEMLVKAIATLEQAEILKTTKSITSQLEETLNKIEQPKDIPIIDDPDSFSFTSDHLLDEQFSI